MISPPWMASAKSSGANGFTGTTSESARAAPVNSDSSSTPASSVREATNSLATRFMPSCSDDTTQTSAAR